MGPWLAFGTTLLGIISTILVYKLNPVNQAKDKLVQVLKDLQVWEGKRDEALSKNDSDGLTIATAKLSGLQHSKASLLQQLGTQNSGR